MSRERARAITGEPVLDGMLRGGIPANRSVLVTGGPGTGKSTLAMQFLQAGLDRGETGLYVSTEQTIDELRDSFPRSRSTSTTRTWRTPRSTPRRDGPSRATSGS